MFHAQRTPLDDHQTALAFAAQPAGKVNTNLTATSHLSALPISQVYGQTAGACTARLTRSVFTQAANAEKALSVNQVAVLRTQTPHLSPRYKHHHNQLPSIYDVKQHVMGPHISVAELSSTLAKTAKEIDSEKAVSSVFVFHLTSGS